MKVGSGQIRMLGGVALMISGLLAPFAPVSAGFSVAGQSQKSANATYLDFLTHKVFQSPSGRGRVTINEKGEWRLQAPGGGVYYIARNPAGGFNYWITAPIGTRFEATGMVGSRGVSVCWKSICQYWLDAADNQPFIVATKTRDDSSRQFFGMEIMTDESAPDAKVQVKYWQDPRNNPAYLVWRKKVPVEQFLGFALADIDAWIVRPSDANRKPAATSIAALPAAPTANANASTGATAVMRHRGGQVVSVDTTQTEAATPLSPQPVSIAAAPIGPVEAKRWGAIAGMIGTVWKDQFTVHSIEWDKPGEAIRIKSEGLYGDDETLIVPDADGKSLRYVYLNTATKQQFDQRIAVERSKAFAILATPTVRTLCAPVAKGGGLSCVARKYVRDKQPDQMRNFTRTDAAGVRVLLAST